MFQDFELRSYLEQYGKSIDLAVTLMARRYIAVYKTNHLTVQLTIIYFFNELNRLNFIINDNVVPNYIVLKILHKNFHIHSIVKSDRFAHISTISLHFRYL